MSVAYCCTGFGPCSTRSAHAPNDQSGDDMNRISQTQRASHFRDLWHSWADDATRKLEHGQLNAYDRVLVEHDRAHCYTQALRWQQRLNVALLLEGGAS